MRILGSASVREVMGTGLIAFDHIISRGANAVSALGGSCGNVLTSLGLLGCLSTPVARLGRDPIGDYLVAELHAANCNVDLVSRQADLRSPVIFEHLDPSTAIHTFDFFEAPSYGSRSRWVSINDEDVAAAAANLAKASIFYTDRVSPAIVAAMEMASRGGTIVYFEPSSRTDEGLFRRALSASSIVKVSADRISLRELAPATSAAIIYTRGARGMILKSGEVSWECPAAPVHRLVDTCGAGDMVTVGVLHQLLNSEEGISPADLQAGMTLGAKLAALNCGFVGARGMFLALGGQIVADGIRRGLDNRFVEQALLLDPLAGYQPGALTRRLHA